MDMKTAINKIPVGEVFGKQLFREVVRQLNPDYTECSINWLLGKLKNENKIMTVGKGKYIRIEEGKRKIHYTYQHSQEYYEIERHIEENYPLVVFQMWEFIQLNEFVNHQIAKNIIFVDVENMLEESVFDLLHMRYPYTLFMPTEEQFYRQRGAEDTVVVQRLVSEAPRPEEAHSSPLEKLLVDLFTSKLTGNLIERYEYKAICEDMFEKYVIDETKLFRYARRRHVEDDIRNYINENTGIRLSV